MIILRYMAAIASGPALVGLIEALVVGASPFLGVGLYGSLGLLAGLLLGLLVTLRGHKNSQELENSHLRVWALMAWLVPAVVIGTFLLFRNVFHEEAGRLPASLLLALLAAILGAGLISRLISICQEYFCRGKYYVLFFLLLGGSLGLSFMTKGQPVVPERASFAADYPGGTVLIVADALRADALRDYSELPALRKILPETPAISNLAEEGLLFEKTYAQASWTKPAMASLLTGKTVASHQVMSKTAVLGEKHRTIAQLFHDNGYQTIGVVNNINISAAFGFARGYDIFTYLDPERYFNMPKEAVKLSLYNGYRLIKERWLTKKRQVENFYQPAAVVTATALHELDRLADKKRPFFLYVHYMDLHDPYFAASGTSYARVTTPYPTEDMAYDMRSAYYDEAGRLDKALADLMSGFQARGLQGKIRYIFTADHGEEFYDHGGFYHGTSLYEEQLHIPLILSGPDMVRGRVKGLSRQCDILPTIAAWHGFAAESGWDGQDLLSGKMPLIHLAEEEHQGYRLQAVISGGYSLITAAVPNRRGLKAVELYDLLTDRFEENDLATLKPALVEELSSFLTKSASSASAEQETALSPDTEAQLRALGYIQ